MNSVGFISAIVAGVSILYAIIRGFQTVVNVFKTIHQCYQYIQKVIKKYFFQLNSIGKEHFNVSKQSF